MKPTPTISVKPALPRLYRLRMDNDVIHPLWAAAPREGLTVRPEGTLLLNGEILRFSGDALPPGTVVDVTMNGGFFYAVSVQDSAEYTKALNLFEQADQQREKSLLDQARDEAQEYLERYDIPFQWKPGIKQVSAGLSERSFGGGFNKSSVLHVQLKEDFEEGRLLRRTNDYLCTTDRGALSVLDSEAAFPQDGSGTPFKPVPTCKLCLKMLERWKKPSAWAESL